MRGCVRRAWVSGQVRAAVWPAGCLRRLRRSCDENGLVEAIAQAHDSTVARIALAWLQAQPGVSSIIIGARRLAQLEGNLQAIVRLTAGELDRLNVLTKPTFEFPQSMQPMLLAIHQGGTTVNGLYAPASGFGIEKGDQPY